MSQTTLTAIFDGQTLRPETPLALEPNARYLITIEHRVDDEEAHAGDAWDVLAQLAGTIDAPPDWANEHDHYLYGTPKRSTGGEHDG